MSLSQPASDPVEAAPRPVERKRGLSPAVWGLVAFGLVCVVAGAAAGVWGARQFPATAGVPQAAPPPAVAAPQPAPAPAPPPQALVAPSSDAGPALGALENQLQRVERQHQATVDAASTALAVASLSQAAETSRPFSSELEAAAGLLPASPDLTALRALAATGAPARSALSSDFDAMAARAAVASRAPPEGAGPFARVLATLATMVTVRRVDRITGSDPDAVLARSERRLAEGDLASAVNELDALPARGREAVAPWRAGAERRLEIERRLAAMRTTALRNLTEARRSGASA